MNHGCFSRLAGLVTIALLALTTILSLDQMSRAADAPSPATQKPTIDPAAMRALRAVCDQISQAKQFSFDTYSTVDTVMQDGTKIEISRSSHVDLQRPNQLHVVLNGDREDLQFFYDGKTATLFNIGKHIFGDLAAPDTIDATLDMLAEKHGLVMPLSDFLFNDPYKTLSAQVRGAEEIGQSEVLGAPARHLAFQGDRVDWEMWVTPGDQQQLIKVVITYKSMPSAPQYIAYFAKWNWSPKFDAETFKFKVPKGVNRVDFDVAPVTRPSGKP